MTLAKAKARANETFIGTGITYDHHLRSSKYFYSTGHRSLPTQKDTWVGSGFTHKYTTSPKKFDKLQHSSLFRTDGEKFKEAATCSRP